MYPQEVQALKKEGKVSHVLAFNEPDGKDQANMTIEETLANWKDLEEIGVNLGSPAAVQAHKEWMQNWFKAAKAKKHRVDFVTVHWCELLLTLTHHSTLERPMV